jgi:hypothetical protein
MKDRSRLVTLAALIALVVAVTSTDSGLPSLGAIGDSLFWVLGAFLVYHLVFNGGCCGQVEAETVVDVEDSE